MSDHDFEHVTTDEAVETYQTAISVFDALLREVRELSKKKPDATLSKNKVKLINAVLEDLTSILEDEPEGKYLALLEDEQLPQVSDALMMMVQFDATAEAFKKRYRRNLSSRRLFDHYWLESGIYWITEEAISYWRDQAELARHRHEDDE